MHEKRGLNLIVTLMAGAVLPLAAFAGDLTVAERGKEPSGGVYVAADASPSQRYAAEELAAFVGKTVGVKLPLVADAAAAKVIIETLEDADLGDDGFVLEEKGGRLYVRGSSVRGCLYGVYEVLERFAGCRWYSSWCEKMPQIDRLAVPAGFRLRDKPAFEMREPFWYDVIVNREFGARIRCNGYNNADEQIKGEVPAKLGGDTYRFGGDLPNCHTFKRLLEPEIYFKDHPEYYALVAGKRQTTQPCLTNPDVLRIVTSNVLARIRKDPTGRFFGVSQNDCHGFCECPACKAIDDEEGSHAGTIIRFANAIAAEVEKEFPKAIIETLAYTYGRKPPKHVKLRPNVVVCLCDIECDFSRPIPACKYEHNRTFCDYITGWGRLSDRLYVWDYTTDFHHYPHVFPNFAALQGNVKFFRDHGVKMLFEQGAYEGYHGGFGELKAYALAKLMWNPDLDWDALVDDFCTGYYGKAAPIVREYLREVTDLQLKWSADGSHPLRFLAKVVEPPYPDDFYARWDARWDEAARLVAGDGVRAYNVRYARFSHDYTKFERLRERAGDDVKLRDDPAAVALARKLLKDVDEARGQVKLREYKGFNAKKMADWREIAKGPATVKVEPWEAALKRCEIVFDRPNGPAEERLVSWAWGKPPTNHLFTTGRPEYVMPVGGGNLSAMVSFGSDNLELHYSMADFVAREDGTRSRNPQDSRMEIRSPGHATIRFDALSTNDIRRFEQRLDMARGRITLAIETDRGGIALEIFGERQFGSVVAVVRDHRLGVKAPQLELTKKCAEMRYYPERNNDMSFVFVAGPNRDMASGAACTSLLELKKVTDNWWRDYWSRGWVSLVGDARARKLEQQYYAFLYSYATVGYGKVPPKFNGGSGLVVEDQRGWGMNMWWQNTRELIWPMGPANQAVLMKNHLDFYASLLERLPGQELSGRKDKTKPVGREWLLAVREVPRSMYSTVLSDAQDYPIDVTAPYAEPTDAELEAVLKDRQAVKGSLGSHIFSSGTELLQQIADYLRFFGDVPPAPVKRGQKPPLKLTPVFAKLLRTQTELYILLSVKGEDGRYHIRCSNVNESWVKADDGIVDLAAARFVFAMTAAHGKRFGFPDSLVAAAAKRKDAMADFPTGRPYAFPNRAPGGVAKILGDVDAKVFHPCALTNGQVKSNQENNELYLVHPFAMAEAEELRQVALETWRRGIYADGGQGWTPVGLTVARMRDPKAADCIYTHAMRSCQWPWGGGYSPGSKLWHRSPYGDVAYYDAMGVVATGVEELLLQSHPAEPDVSLETGGPVRICPCLPEEWCGSFKLLARGGFEVTAHFLKGKPTEAKVKSLRGNDFTWIDPESGERRTRKTAAGEEFTVFKARPRPSPQLLKRVSGDDPLEIMGIIHYSLNTYTDREWGYGDEQPQIFAPDAFDPDQIARACKAAGMKGLVIVAKHHDGFCLWPTKTTKHNITLAKGFRKGRGDYVRELADALRRNGVEVGFYCSPWDRNNAAYARADYVKTFHDQVKELTGGGYGPAFEMWFDGANGGSGYYGGANERRSIPKDYYRFPELIRELRRTQPDICIMNGGDHGDFRFPGNERGVLSPSACSTCWSLARRPEGHPDGVELFTGNPEGDLFKQHECCFPMRPGWFYHEAEDGRTKSAEYLMKIYLRTVGNSGFINIGISPDKHGRLTDEDVAALEGLGRLRREFFANEVTDGGACNVVVLREDVSSGERVGGWELRAKGKVLCAGPAIGIKRIRILDEDVAAKDLELVVTKKFGEPVLKPVRFYRADRGLVRRIMSSRNPKRAVPVTAAKGGVKGNVGEWSFASPQVFRSVVITPDSKNVGGAPVRFSLAFSEDGRTWFGDTGVLHFGNVAANPIPQIFTLGKEVRAQHLRLVCETTFADKPLACAAPGVYPLNDATEPWKTALLRNAPYLDSVTGERMPIRAEGLKGEIRNVDGNLRLEVTPEGGAGTATLDVDYAGVRVDRLSQFVQEYEPLQGLVRFWLSTENRGIDSDVVGLGKAIVLTSYDWRINAVTKTLPPMTDRFRANGSGLVAVTRRDNLTWGVMLHVAIARDEAAAKAALDRRGELLLAAEKGWRAFWKKAWDDQGDKASVHFGSSEWISGKIRE